jgi:acetylornithine deacetylase/succinyl-diaminopimelate desuccinylase-like protein
LVSELEFSSEDLNDTIRLFQGLIRIDTTNPPGNEGKAAEFLKEQFEKNGVECEVLGEPGRENAIAKIRGPREKLRLLLLSHTDVVPAVNVGEWTHPPFCCRDRRQLDLWSWGMGRQVRCCSAGNEPDTPEAAEGETAWNAHVRLSY